MSTCAACSSSQVDLIGRTHRRPRVKRPGRTHGKKKERNKKKKNGKKRTRSPGRPASYTRSVIGAAQGVISPTKHQGTTATRQTTSVTLGRKRGQHVRSEKSSTKTPTNQTGRANKRPSGKQKPAAHSGGHTTWAVALFADRDQRSPPGRITGRAGLRANVDERVC